MVAMADVVELHIARRKTDWPSKEARLTKHPCMDTFHPFQPHPEDGDTNWSHTEESEHTNRDHNNARGHEQGPHDKARNDRPIPVFTTFVALSSYGNLPMS